MRGVEALEGGQFQNTLDLSFENHRQHQDALRRGAPQAGRDLDITRGHIGEQDLLLLHRALPHDALAQGNTVAHHLLSLVGVAGQQGQLSMFPARIQDIEGRALGRNHRSQL